jgi:hypothetical protein
MATNPAVSEARTRLTESSPARKVLLVSSLVFVVDTFLAWQKVCFGDVCGSATAWHGVGIVAALLGIAVLVLEVLRLFGIELHLDRGTEARVVAALAVGTLVFTVIKFLVHNEFRAYGTWIGLIAAAIIAVGGVMALGEANAAALRERRATGGPTAQT